MHEFIIVSWNVERMGLAKASEQARPIARKIADSIVGMENGDRVPFIGFLLEVKGTEGAVRGILQQLVAAIPSDFRANHQVRAQAVFCGGESNTEEWIIVFYHGMDVTTGVMDVRAEMGPVIDQDKQNAKGLFDDHKSMKESRGLRSQPKPTEKIMSFGMDLGSSEQKYIKIDHDVGWFRNGVICKARSLQGGGTVKIASVHAPGPRETSKSAEIIQAIKRAGISKNVDALIGDFNVRGDLSGDGYVDLSSLWATGTTLSTTHANLFTDSKWDRLLVRAASGFEVKLNDPVHPGFMEDASEETHDSRISDHGLIIARLRKLAGGPSAIKKINRRTTSDSGDEEDNIHQTTFHGVKKMKK